MAPVTPVPAAVAPECPEELAEVAPPEGPEGKPDEDANANTMPMPKPMPPEALGPMTPQKGSAGKAEQKGGLAEGEANAQALMDLMKKKATAAAAAKRAKEGDNKRKLPWGRGVATK